MNVKQKKRSRKLIHETINFVNFGVRKQIKDFYFFTSYLFFQGFNILTSLQFNGKAFIKVLTYISIKKRDKVYE